MKYLQQPKNPFGKFILGRMQSLNLTRPEVVKGMGYSNIAKGLRRLDTAIDGCSMDKVLLLKLAQVLRVSIPGMNEQIKEMNRYLNEKLEKQCREAETKARLNFVPYLQAICRNRVPQPIFVGAMCSKMRFRDLNKDIIELPHIDQLLDVGSKIRDHFSKHEKKGIPAFGSILGYAYRRDFDENREDVLLFNTNGYLTNNRFEEEYKLDPGSFSFKLKRGRNILPLFELSVEE